MLAKEQENQSESREIPRLFCLTGCTAVGKTELSLRWSEANGAEIVNCDSLLFYRGMDIGTAKPTARERARVPHHMIDILGVTEQMDIGRFIELATEVILEIQSRGKRVLVTGGSGFYLKAFFEPVVDAVAVSDKTIAFVDDLMERGPVLAVKELRDRNPDGLGSLDVANPRRVRKALERCVASGLTLQNLADAFAKQTNPLIEADKSLCILERETEELNDRIRQRVVAMVESGLLEEVNGLKEAGIERNPSASNAIGYRESLAYLAGEYSIETLIEKITVNTRRLAKKQRTWFRGQIPADARRVSLRADSLPALGELFELGDPVV